MTYATVAGADVTRARVHVPARGAWVADVVLVDETELSGRVVLEIGGVRFSGTVVGRSSGTADHQRSARIVGGAGGWGATLPPKDYRSDAGLRARTIVEDLVRESGEELAAFSPASETIGVHYARRTLVAAVSLEQAIGGASWWVDFDGRTHVGSRSSVAIDEGAVDVLEYDPLTRIATLGVDALTDVPVGAQLEVGLDAPQVVAELTITVDDGRAQVTAWCGEDARGRLAGAFASAVERVTAGRLLGVYRYRVTQRSGERLELQAVRRDAGLPDALPIAMVPGVAGAYAELAPGAVVYLEFVEGDATMPIVRGFASRGEAGHEPETLALVPSTTLRLGSSTATQRAVLGTDQATAIKGHLDDLLTWGALVATGITAGGGTLDNTALVAAVAATKTALDNALSVKVRVSP